jgi:hypothetical protein
LSGSSTLFADVTNHKAGNNETKMTLAPLMLTLTPQRLERSTPARGIPKRLGRKRKSRRTSPGRDVIAENTIAIALFTRASNLWQLPDCTHYKAAAEL